jgi:polysaccharide biosynthesis transport protein
MDLNTSQQDVHLSQYWNVIRKRWKVAAAIVLVVLGGTFLASYFSKPLYRSAIQIQIDPESNAITVETIFGIAASDQEFLQTQYVLLKSRGLALRVVEEHKLYNDAELNPGGITGKTPGELAVLKTGIADGLRAGIEVTPVRGTSLVDIAYVGTSARLAQKVAEAWGDSYMRMNISKKLDSMKQANDFLMQQIGTVKADLELSRRQLQDYSAAHGIVAIGESGGGSVTMSKVMQLSTDVTTAQRAVIERQAAYNSLQRTSPDAVTTGDPLVARISEEQSKLEREYAEKLSQFREAHPVMRQLADQIAKARSAKTAAVRQAYTQLLESARSNLAAAQAQESSVRSAYQQATNEARKSDIDAAQYIDLRQSVDTKQEQLGSLQKQLTEAEMAGRARGMTTSNIHWIDHAQPGNRFNLSMKKNLQSAFPLGVILGLAAIFFLEYMDRSVKTPEDLERLTGFASLGVIPAAGSVTKQGYGYGYGYGRTPARLRAVETAEDKQEGIELIPHTDARSPISEAYRAFRTSLLLASASSPKVIAITSSFAREGKTTTSVNLATVLAQMGKPVLLVDADLRRPRLQKVFQGRMNLGLVNYLAANIPLDDIIQASEVPNLSIVLSGPIPPNPSELLASDRMKHLIEEVRGKFAYVIFDSPPVLAVTDAVVLGANSDGVVLCVHGGHTPRELVQRSAERLRQANIPVLGAILNNLDLHQYGYTYRKNYYDYYESNDDEAQKSRKTS